MSNPDISVLRTTSKSVLTLETDGPPLRVWKLGIILKNCFLHRSSKATCIITAMRTSPNVVIVSTSGMGKTVHRGQLVEETGLKRLSINQVVEERGCHEVLKSYIVDED